MKGRASFMALPLWGVHSPIPGASIQVLNFEEGAGGVGPSQRAP
jgi:hypothetical protein